MRYSDAGVDRELLRTLKEMIGKQAKITHSAAVCSRRGYFASAFKLGPNQVLVQSADGVGTILILAEQYSMAGNLSLSICGASLVNHCVNDILCAGARPFTFLDYITSDKFEASQIEALMAGMVYACREHGIALVGGEIAQMTDVYKDSQLDVAGFISGIVEDDSMIDGSKIKPGDVLVGLPSVGLHTNGYSLVRKIMREKNLSLDYSYSELGGELGSMLLKLHRSYFKVVYNLLRSDALPRDSVHGIAHITGGGLPENIARILPRGREASVRLRSWPIPAIFQFIQKEGEIPTEEMFQVFNMGIGMVLIVAKERLDAIFREIRAFGEDCYLIGEVKSGKRGVCFYEEDRCFCSV